MKITASTLLALCMAVPATLADEIDSPDTFRLAQPLTVSVTTTLTSGSFTIFPDKVSVNVDHEDGQDPQQIGKLHFSALGSADVNFARFDIIDDGQSRDSYTKCKVWLVKDPKVKEKVIEVQGQLAHLDLGEDAAVKWNCRDHKNGE